MSQGPSSKEAPNDRSAQGSIKGLCWQCQALACRVWNVSNCLSFDEQGLMRSKSTLERRRRASRVSKVYVVDKASCHIKMPQVENRLPSPAFLDNLSEYQTLYIGESSCRIEPSTFAYG